MPKVIIKSEYCKSCGLCINICPKKVLFKGNSPNSRGYYPVEADDSKCIACSLCGLICPDIAIEIYK